VYAYMCDAADGYTPETGITTPTVYLSKNGGAPAAPSALDWAELDDTHMPGIYTITLSATDTDTVGPLAIDVIKSGTSRHFAAVYYVSAALVDDVKGDTAAILVDTGTDGVLLAATATSPKLVDDVWDELNAGHVTAGTTGKKLNDVAAATNPWDTDPATYTTAGTFGYAIARAISGAGANLTTITVQDADDNPIEGVRVDIYSAATPSTATYYTHGDTNASGQVSLYLPVGVWFAFRYKRGYSFNDPVTVTVT